MSASLAPRLYALVPCAGTGSRSGANQPKQYVHLAGRPMVQHTLNALLAVRRLQAVLVVLSAGDEHFAQAASAFDGPRAWVAAVGGDTRAATVANGLVELQSRGASADDWVLVHDAARCLLRPDWVDALIDACIDDAVGGLLALPVADTLKREAVASGGPQDAVAGAHRVRRVEHTVDRRLTWAAQTPQMFRIGQLQRALALAGSAVTDESSAIEAQGLQPQLVEAPAENFKVTWPADFALAERLLLTRISTEGLST